MPSFSSPRPPRTILRPTAGSGGWFHRRRLSAVIASVVVLLIVGALLADHILGAQIRTRLIAASECLGGTGGSINVQLGGPPMLVQLARRELDSVTVTGLSVSALEGARTQSDAATVIGDAPLTLHLRDVQLRQPLTIGSANVSTVIPWSALQARLAQGSGGAGSTGAAQGLLSGAGLRLTADGDQLAVEKADAFMGQSVRVLMSIAVSPDGLNLTPQTVQVGNRQVRADLMAQLLGSGLGAGALGGGSTLGADALGPRTVDLSLPKGLSLESAEVESEGLAVSLNLATGELKDAKGSQCMVHA